MTALFHLQATIKITQPPSDACRSYYLSSGEKTEKEMKKILTASIVVMLIGLALPNAHASTSDKQSALNVALRYGNSVHCQGEAFHEDRPLNSVFRINEMRYAVLQTVDLICSGGSGTVKAILTPVNVYVSRAAVDLQEYPEGDMLENHPIGRFIERASYDESKKYLTLTHLEYDDNDSMPSLKYRTVINLENNRIINQQFLGVAK